MFDRPSSFVAFLVILAVCTAGAFKASPWTIVAGACLLVLVSLNNRWRPRAYTPFGARAVSDPVQLLASALNGGATSCAGYMLGQAAALVWGL